MSSESREQLRSQLWPTGRRAALKTTWVTVASVIALSTAGWSRLSATDAASTAQASPASRWHNVGSMQTPRTHQTATLLQDGRVLVTGGGDGQRVLNSAELYDPTTRQWTPTGSMTTGRSFHSATLLQDGRVLVAGGAGATRTYTSSKVYDPPSGTWSPTGNLLDSLAEQSATGLPNGLVLVAGGTSDEQNGNQLDTTQVYEPASSQWYAAGRLTVPRRGVATTTLADGRVLAAGGFGNGHVLASADLLDPGTGELATQTHRSVTSDGNEVVQEFREIVFTPKWQPVGGMATPRESPTATLLQDGTILVAGGLQSDVVEASLASTEIFDTAAGNNWRAAGPMTMSRVGHTATSLPNGEVLVTGGMSTTCTTGAASCTKNTAELYDPGSGSWTATDIMSSWRSQQTATLLADGTVLIVGGEGAQASGMKTAPLATAEIYQP